mgnify:CR=1 FL=1
MMFTFIPLAKHAKDGQSRRALGVGAGALGLLVAVWAQSNPTWLAESVESLAVRGVAVVAAALLAAIGFWKLRRIS